MNRRSADNAQPVDPAKDIMLTDLTTYLKEQETAMHDALRRLVLIPSGTYNKAGVDAVCREIYALLEELPLERRILPQEQYGDMLIASVPPAETEPRILLAGHMDTIFPADSPFRGWREDETNFYGPGVIDMKGGIVVGIFALKALAALGLLRDLPVTWIFNSEEEIGSPVSRALFTAEAKRSAMAFVLEPGGSRGEVATGRKGRLGMKIFARGVAGHAAQVVEGKKSAILDLARVIVELEGLNGGYPGVSVNVGQMAGGIIPNSVPDEAWATIDVRSPSAEGLAFFHSRLDDLLKRRGSGGDGAQGRGGHGGAGHGGHGAEQGPFRRRSPREARKAGHPRCGAVPRRGLGCEHHRGGGNSRGGRARSDRGARPQRPGISRPGEPRSAERPPGSVADRRLATVRGGNPLRGVPSPPTGDKRIG